MLPTVLVTAEFSKPPPELLEVHSEPSSPVSVVRGVLNRSDPAQVTIVVNYSEVDVWVSSGDVVGWAS